MAVSGPRRAVDRVPARASGRPRWQAARQFAVDGLLWALGGLGLLSLLAAVAAHVFGFSIILFSTGSMTPTIPAGSAALVRLLPASEIRVGDIATVERQNLLPITHRITSVKPLEGSPSARVITMRGDANDLDDPEPYVISNARLVLASVPGVAQVFTGLRNPVLMLALTLLVGGLVTWAFWPRQTRRASLVAAAALVAGSQLLGASDAQAMQTEHQVIGSHLVLTVISDNEAMASMVPGVPVLWQVGVTTRADEEGALHIGLGITSDSVDADALQVDVLACPQRWEGETCSGVSQTWVGSVPLDRAFLPSTHDEAREVGSTAAGTPVWVLVRATLHRPAPDVKATLKLSAWGAGEVVEAATDDDPGGTQGPDGLAYTGSGGTLETLALGGAAIAAGLAVAWFAGRRRGDSDRGDAR